jgi:hypothetical protein
MPNWSNNVIAVKGNTTKVMNWLKSGVNVPDDVKLGNLADWLNKQKISLDDFSPMPQTFKDWDTTNQMRQFDTWFTETLFNGMGFMGEISPITLPKKVVKHFLDYARPLLGLSDFAGLRRVFRRINETTGGQYHKFANDYFAGVPDDIRKLIENTYDKYCDGYKEAAKYQKETYGVVGWYDWGLQYRGTKWNADLHDWQVDVSADGKECIIYVCCETAWSMPEGWLATMQKNNDDLTFFIRGDEEAQFFNGYACARNLDDWVENDTELYDKAKDEISKEWEDEGKITDEDDDDYDEGEFEDEVWTRQQELSEEITNRFYEYVSAYEVESVSEN